MVSSSAGTRNWGEDKMKRIINNKLYDTEKAKKICDFKVSVKHNSFYFPIYLYHEACIYKTNKGTYLKYIGKCVESEEDYEKYRKLEVISIEEVKRLLIQINAIDVYISEFGELEEG